MHWNFGLTPKIVAYAPKYFLEGKLPLFEVQR